MERVLIWIGIMLLSMGVFVIGIGLLLGRGGRLSPGDIVISRPGFTLVFPIMTSVLASIALTFLLWLIIFISGRR